MKTLRYINDMLQHDKEYRELRKRNRERLTDNYHLLLDTEKETALSQMTVEKMEDIHRITLGKEDLDKAAYFKAMLYLALRMGLVLPLIWLLVGCSGKQSGNNQSAVKSDSASITQSAQTISVHTQDTICHLPVATQSVKDSAFTEQELKKIQNELRERYAHSEIKGTQLDGNIQAWSIKGNHLVVQLCLNSPEVRAIFREKIMDSPAIRFEGPTEPTPNNKRYTSDTLGIHLYPEFSAYPYTAHTATFVLFNQSDHEITFGEHYRITYEDKQGVWRKLPIHTVFNSIAYSIQPGTQFLFKANLNPNVLPNRPGRYRFFYEVELANKNQKIMLMTEFRLADIKKAVRDSSDIISVEYGGESNEREHTFWQSDEWKIINRNGNKLLEYTVIREDKAVKELLIRYSHSSGSIRSLTYTYPEDIALADNFHAEVTLKDLNFDGQDDIAIPLGNYGNQRIQYEDGYLWDKTQKTYVPVKQLKEIANPRIDKEERCLFSFSRESAASYHYERYEYVGTELVKTAELIQTYRQAGGKPLFTEKHYQKGKGMRVVHSSVPIHEISHYWLKIVQK